MGKNIEILGQYFNSYNQASQYARDNAGILRETAGRVIDIEDPLEQGRIRVVLREVDPKYLEENGYPQGAATETESDWINPFPAFKGKQPKSLLEKRVKIMPSQGDPNKMIFGDVLYDIDDDPTIKEIPNSSNMTRLPIYKAGELPPPTAENIGCVVVEEGGPCSSDWLCVCLKRRGSYYWVRHIDINHIHQDQDDGIQPPDGAGDGEEPVDEGPIWDKVAPTTDKQYNYQSYDPLDSDWFGGA